MNVILSICIPTYNRAVCLRECLDSILASIVGREPDVEIVISDNASIDNTKDVVLEFQKNHPWIRYHRHPQTILGELNFRFVASLAQGEFIWIFGDDDKMEVTAVAAVLKSVRAGYNLTICNYSTWNKTFSIKLKDYGLVGNVGCVINDRNKVLCRFGLHLGYITSVVIRKNLFFKLPELDYHRYVEYGFPFIYAIYYGIAANNCRVNFIADQIFCNRGENSGDYDWYKYFVTGSSLIFDELQHKGYSKSAVRAAKRQVLKEFVLPNLFGMKLKMLGQDNKQVFNLLFKHYKSYWQFWAYCVPKSLAPASFIIFAKRIRQQVHGLIGVK